MLALEWQVSFSAMQVQRIVEQEGQPGAAWPFRGRERRGWRMDPHSHVELEANLLLRGQATMLVAGRRVDVHAGDLLWLPPGQQHGLLAFAPNCHFAIVVIAPEVVESTFDSEHPLRRTDPFAEPLRRLSLQRCRALGQLASDLQRLTAASAGNHQALASGLSWWLHQAWEAWQEGSPRPLEQLHPAVLAAMAAWQQDPALDLEQVAAVAGISASRLRRLVQRDLGMGVVAWRNRLRLQKFLDLAQRQTAGKTTAGDNLLHICFAAGFGSYAQFHRIFVQYFALPPSRWREVLGFA